MKSPILLVDDDPDLCELIEDTLSDAYAIHTCHDEISACATFAKLNPGIVLLDINLPNGNGLKLCQKLIEQANHYPMVLMLSGDSGPDMQLQAYDSGGSDFLPKPFRIKELRARVDKLNEFYQRQCQLQASSSAATQSAKIAMAEASQYGEVVQFYNAMYRAESVEEIRDSFFALMDTFGLSSSMQIRSNKIYSYDYRAAECSPIELQIYERFFKSKRLIVFYSRLLINGQYVSAIVKNMPSKDQAGCTRLHEILATIIDGIDTKLLDIQRLELLKQTSTELYESNLRLSQTVKQHRTKIRNMIDQMTVTLNGDEDSVEMNPEKKQHLSQLRTDTLKHLDNSFNDIANEAQVLDCLQLSLATVLNQSSV